ncbi:para-aminobenzoate synthetase component 1 [Saccharicrinis carchari]|uniref:Para-aminobenzoate synthetase component 1 n=1 Tax=Saccharicrinis carchari TaxID=1168039 RepID=A0A521B2X6_SACCC|nr:anthranilate synthase component I family protein [Saccharicrinis carchari]SMO41428.1 para-aminobenzoate synthetase component 1 [Saccharicrinis carchari]
MRQYITFDIGDSAVFKKKLVHFCATFEYAAVYDSNDYYCGKQGKVNYNSFNFLAGLGHISKVKGDFDAVYKFHNKHRDWLCGYWGYDLKNKLEKLSSDNKDGLQFSDASFFRPRYIIQCSGTTCTVGYIPEINHKNEIQELIDAIVSQAEFMGFESEIKFKSRVSEKEYVDTVNAVLKHIYKGDIYEMNYCMEFYAHNAKINPYAGFNDLIKISPTPFASFLKAQDKFALCASPERYIKKEGANIISQPIKGTAKRTDDIKKDEAIKNDLACSVKERSENIMIVDLVRNDLSRVAAPGSVKVEELCGIYPFAQVFQMISTITAQLGEGKEGIEAIKASFPPGSMTGAPKIRAMKIIEKYEYTKRGLYSGALGFFTPDGDFDFNVVIRTLLYDAANHYLSFMVGSAITEKSMPHLEYKECLLKAKAILQLFNQNKLSHIESSISEVSKK